MVNVETSDICNLYFQERSKLNLMNNYSSEADRNKLKPIGKQHHKNLNIKGISLEHL